MNTLSLTRVQCETGASDVLHTTNTEVALSILTGSCTVVVTDSCRRRQFTNLGNRLDVFSGLPTTLLLGPGVGFQVITETSVDILVAKFEQPTYKELPTTLIRPDDVMVHQVGRGNMARTVRQVVSDQHCPYSIRMGETVNPPGNWSSFPPHHFEVGATGNEDFEEYFFYVVRPRHGTAVQVRKGYFPNNEAVNDTVLIQNGDILPIPLGYHPVVAAPDTEVFYGWCYVGPEKVYAESATDGGNYK